MKGWLVLWSGCCLVDITVIQIAIDALYQVGNVSAFLQLFTNKGKHIVVFIADLFFSLQGRFQKLWLTLWLTVDQDHQVDHQG